MDEFEIRTEGPFGQSYKSHSKNPSRITDLVKDWCHSIGSDGGSITIVRRKKKNEGT